MLIAIVCLGLSQKLFAAKGGSSIGGFFGSAGAAQDDLNTLISAANTRSTISTGRLSGGLELAFQITFRLSKSIGLQFRPSYFWASAKGTGAAGVHNYGLTGYTLFPVLKWYMLQDKSIKFFTQFGMGFGSASGTIEEGAARAAFTGSNMGFLVGLGAEFCFYKAKHCLILEGNYRYLPFPRNLIDSTSGTFDSGSIDTPTSGRELEFNDIDLSTTLSGILANIGYAYNF